MVQGTHLKAYSPIELNLGGLNLRGLDLSGNLVSGA